MTVGGRVSGWRLPVVILLGSFVTACAGMGTDLTIQKSSVPPAVRLAAVPFYAQRKHQCGPAALAMVLQWSSVNVSPDQLAPVAFTPGLKGSLQSGLIAAARRYGRLAYPVKGLQCVLEEVAAGRPVIVLQNLGLRWLPRWHYAVVIGYDLDQQFVILHSGESASRQVGLRTFINTWKRAEYWGLLTLPVNLMPRCVQEAPYLRAAWGLQLAGHTAAAIQAFENAVIRWPASPAAYLALGNACYADGAVQKAMDAFAHAVRIDPDNASGFNNLAHLLAESGNLAEAETMARKAVSLGGPHLEVYRQTLNEIRQMRHRE